MNKKIIWAVLGIVILVGILVLLPRPKSVTETPFVRNTAGDIYHPVSGRLEHEGYEGVAVIKGTYQTYERIELIELFFKPDAQSEAKLPEHHAGISFSNAKEAAIALGISPTCLESSSQVEKVDDNCFVEGEAEIVVSNFKKYMVASDGTDLMKLEKVISADPPQLIK